METRAHHVLIGVFTIGVFLLGVGFVLWLSKASTDREFNYYDIVFTEAVTGLSKGGLVQYNGIKVGEVAQLKLAPDDPRKVIARIKVGGDTPIRKDTKAKLGLLGLTGVAFIQLSGGSPSSPNLRAEAGEQVPVINADVSALQKLLSSSEDVVTSLNDILYRTAQLVSKENVDKISSMLTHFEEISSTLAGQRDHLGEAITQFAAASGELRHTIASLNKMANTTDRLLNTDVRRALDAANKALDQIDRVAESASGLLDDNRASVRSFTNQGLRQVGPAMAELRETLRSFKQLTEQLSANPARFILGRDKPKEFEGK
jgi:phospholipid/cholesterol/gamma-HCH transport system substrate-binding protein